MAVYRRGYQRYQGEVVSQWTRFMVLPRFAWNRIFQQRLVILLIVASMIWPLLCGIFIYLTNNADLLKGLSSSFRSFVENKGTFFLTFLYVQSIFAMFLAALTGPGLIAPDLANNALPLYFSRPLRRIDYALARLTTLLGLLSIVTWVPGLVLFAMQAGMASPDWLRENWRLSFGLFVGSVIWMLLVSMVAMASSAYARLKAVSGGLVLGFFFILSGVSEMINGIFRVTWAKGFSPTWACHRIWCAMLDVTPQSGPGIAGAITALLAYMFLLALVIERKLRPVEVIS